MLGVHAKLLQHVGKHAWVNPTVLHAGCSLVSYHAHHRVEHRWLRLETALLTIVLLLAITFITVISIVIVSIRMVTILLASYLRILFLLLLDLLFAVLLHSLHDLIHR